MNRFLTLVLAVLPMLVQAQVNFKINEKCEVPKKDVQIEGTKVIVTYDFPEMTEIVDPKTNEFLYHEIPGFGQCSEVGMPKLPMRIDTFYVPDGYEMSVSTTGVLASTKDCSYMAVQAPAPDGLAPQTVNYDITPYDGMYPSLTATLMGTFKMRDKKYADIAVSPIQYDYDSQKAYIYKRLIFTLNYKPIDNSGVDPDGGDPTPSGPQFQGFTSLFKMHPVWGSLWVMNPMDAVGFEGSVGYIIVTTNKYLEALKPFIDWKRVEGFTTHLLTKERWANSREVRNAVRECRTNNPDSQYLLIVGDIDEVPATRIAINKPTTEVTLKAHYTDSQYGTMNNADFIPDIYMGRIPVTVEEAEGVIDKIVDCEMSPIQDPEFYTNSAHCSYFQGDSDNNDMTRESSRFILTSEEIRNYVANFGIIADRVYALEPGATPLKYNPIYSEGDSIPEYLRIPNFAWNSTSSDIINKINSGTYYALYRAHGSTDGWSNLNFETSDLESLDNKSKYPIVFSITCNTGEYNQDCFAERLLNLPHSGASAVFAASQESWSGYNDALIEGMFDAIWPEPGIVARFGDLKGASSEYKTPTPTPTYRLGQIIEQGLLRMKEQFVSEEYPHTKYQYEIYHLFGDPSMYFHTQMPKQFENVSIERLDDKIIVDTHGEVATISFYNFETDEVHRFQHHRATLCVDDHKQYYVCLTAPNRLPYIDIYQISQDNEPLMQPKIKKAIVKDSETAGVQIFAPQSQDRFEVRITDISGRVCAVKSVESYQSSQEIELPLNNNKGVFIVSLISNGIVIDTTKIIK